jgi:hypothetical protein
MSSRDAVIRQAGPSERLSAEYRSGADMRNVSRSRGCSRALARVGAGVKCLRVSARVPSMRSFTPTIPVAVGTPTELYCALT